MLNNLREISGNVTAQMQNIEHDGDLIVDGNVESGSYIVATGTIQIKGNVYNAKIKSLKSNILIEGGIKGVSTIIYAGGGNIQTKYVYNATLKADQSVIIDGVVIDAHIIAKKSIFVENNQSAIEGGEIEAGMDIVATSIGNQKRTATIIKIADFKQREIFAQIMKYDKQIDVLQVEMKKLEKFIDIIKLLGKKVVALPLEKKQDLALKVQRYNELKAKFDRINLEKQGLYIGTDENDEDTALERSIIARKHLFEGVHVYMDKSKLIIQSHYTNVILYKRGIIIVGDYDKFMHRKKYAY